MATNSLGRLTLDLIAKTGGFERGMDKAARHSQRRTREMQQQWRKLKNFIMGVGAALGVAFSARALQNVIRSNAQLIDTLAKSADAMGIQIDRLQALQYAAELSGVSTEQLSTSMQRMSRSLGDAARGTTGATRAVADLGLNLDELLAMSPDRQLETIAKAFGGVDDQARRASIAQELFGRSGTQMLNVLRAVEQDGLQPFANTLEEMGFLLDREGAARVEQMNDSLATLSLFSQGAGRQLTIALAPAIQAVAMSLTEASKESGGFGDEMQSTADKVVQGMAFGADAVAGFVRVWQIAGRGVAVVALQIELRMAQLTDSILNGPANAVNSLIGLLNRLPQIDLGEVGPMFGGSRNRVRELQAAIREGMADIQGVATQDLPGAGILANYEEAKQQAETAGREIAARLNQGLVSGIAAGPEQSVSGVIGRQVEEVNREMEQFMQAGQRVFEETRTPAEQLAIRIEYLNGLLNAGAVDWDTYSRAIFAAQEAFDTTRESAKVMAEDVQDGTSQMSEFAVQAARNIQSAFADFLFDPFNSNLRDMASGFAQTLHRMVSELLAQQILLSFFNAMGGGGIWGQLAGAVIGGARADGGPVSPGKAYLVGERGPELFVPGAAGNIQPNGSGQGVRIINVIDPSMVADYMSGPGGDQVVLNVLKRNAGAVRQVVT